MAIKESNPIKIPEGKVLASAKIYCQKHGEITDKSFFLSYIIDEIKDGKTEPMKHNHVYCTACICEYLESLKEKGVLAEVGIIPIFKDKQEFEEELKKDAKFSEVNSRLC